MGLIDRLVEWARKGVPNYTEEPYTAELTEMEEEVWKFAQNAFEKGKVCKYMTFVYRGHEISFDRNYLWGNEYAYYMNGENGLRKISKTLYDRVLKLRELKRVEEEKLREQKMLKKLKELNGGNNV